MCDNRLFSVAPMSRRGNVTRLELKPSQPEFETNFSLM
jgi:hypothetical protein